MIEKILTPYERQKRYIAKWTAKGFKKLTLWVHNDDIEKVTDLVKKLKDKREKKRR